MSFLSLIGYNIWFLNLDSLGRIKTLSKRVGEVRKEMHTCLATIRELKSVTGYNNSGQEDKKGKTHIFSEVDNQMLTQNKSYIYYTFSTIRVSHYHILFRLHSSFNLHGILQKESFD